MSQNSAAKSSSILVEYFAAVRQVDFPFFTMFLSSNMRFAMVSISKQIGYFQLIWYLYFN